jgi:hypothetical protein
MPDSCSMSIEMIRRTPGRKPVTNKPIVAMPAQPECAVCMTPPRCGSLAWREQRGPRCAGKADGPDDCDCINVCGDDPWLKDGRATPCASRQQHHANQA